MITCSVVFTFQVEFIKENRKTGKLLKPSPSPNTSHVELK